jgi:hypothetical protein
MAELEDFVEYMYKEMPARAVLISGVTEASGDPRSSLLTKVQNAPAGTDYDQYGTALRWRKLTQSDPTSWILAGKTSASSDPNSDSDLDSLSAGELYLQTGSDPVIIWIKNRAGASGWDILGAASSLNHPQNAVYLNVEYTGTYVNGSEIFPFKTPQAAVDYIEAQTTPPSLSNQWDIFWIGEYTGEVEIHMAGVNFYGHGLAKITSSGGASSEAVTFTNATTASVATYHSSGTYSDLINQGDAGPQANIWYGIDIVGKLELLGVQGDAGAGLTDFGGSVATDIAITVKAVKSGGLIYARNIYGPFIYESSFGESTFVNSASVKLRNGSFGAFSFGYDSADPNGEPNASGNSYINGEYSSFSSLTISGSSILQTATGSNVIGDVTLSNTASFEPEDIIVQGNVVLSNDSEIQIKGGGIKGNLTINAGNTGANHSIEDAYIGGTITDPDELLSWTGDNIDAVSGLIYVGNNSKGFANGSYHYPFTGIEAAIGAVSVENTTIVLLKDESVGVITIGLPAYSLTIDGNGHVLTRTSFGTLFQCNQDVDSVVFRNFEMVNIRVQLLTGMAAGNEVVFDNIKMTNGRIIPAAAVAYEVTIKNSTVLGNNQSLIITNADAIINILHSKIVGASGNRALYFNGVVNNNVEIRNSSILHGSGGSNNPFQLVSATGPVTFSAANSVFNTDPEDADFVNSVEDSEIHNVYLDAASVFRSTHGSLYISDITTPTPGAEVSDRVYANPPTNTILTGCTTSSVDIDVDVICSYSKAKVITTQGTYENADLDPNGLLFEDSISATVGSVDETIEIRAVTPNGQESARQTVDVIIELPPELTALSFADTYPGSQTEYKEDDTVRIVGTTDVLCSGVEIMAPSGSYSDGACKAEVINFAATTSIDVTVSIADQGNSTVARPGYVRAKNAAGAYGSVRATNEGGGSTDHVHLVYCNNLYPSVSFGTKTYPPTQYALKGSESATVVNTVTNFNTISYTSPNGDLSITSPSTYQTPKTVTRIAGSYNDSVNNLRITATRAANDASTTRNTIVEIANVAPTINITEPSSRLRSGGNDSTSAQNHTITLSSNQKLYVSPIVYPDGGGGVFLGSWAGGPKTWTRSLQVHDDDTKATHSWTGLVATNGAGIVQNTISGNSTYVIGGFVARDVYFSPAATTGSINVAVVTYTKLTASSWSLSPSTPLLNPVQGNHDNIASTYTVDSIGTNPTDVYCNDEDLVDLNTLGMYLYGLEEEV